MTSIAEVFRTLSSSEHGISVLEAEKRLSQYGYNEIVEKKTRPIIKFLSFFWGPIPWMIEAAILLSVVIRHWIDFGIILTLLIFNAIVGFWQEHKADNAIELLKQKLALQTRVLRDNQWIDIPARELVLGDVVRIRLGDIIPADVKLIEGEYLLVDESTLTGESLPVEKKRGDIAYSGSIARQGEVNALVIATGMHTYFGKTARLVEKAKTESHFQKAILKIGNYLIFLAAILIGIIFVAAFLRQESFLDILRFALVLTVAAIPVALPAILSVTMAIGAMALAKKEAIVSKLLAIEEMAEMDVLCSDKTGTITKNELSIAQVEPFPSYNEQDVLLFAVLASRVEDKDPIDDAIISKAKTLPEFTTRSTQYNILAFKPFDPIIKHTEAILEDSNKAKSRVAKGAPQVILSMVADKDKIVGNVEKQVDAFARKGYRALGVARTDSQDNWRYLGLIALYDPPREDSAETIQIAENMCIPVKMVTGDHTAIAREIAHQVNLGSNILTAEDFNGKADKEAEILIEKADGFAQVFPEHKYHIVELLQNHGHIVGMTGDGVNDAPALKKADVGIAVAGASDAAKSAADIVLIKPGLSIVIDAIKESRKIFQRMTNYSIYRIAETIRALFFITLSILIYNFYPVTALMIVLLALLNDAPIMTIAYDNVHYSNKPEKWNMRTILGMATMLGMIGVISSILLFIIGKNVLQLNRDTLQSFIFLKLIVAGHLTMFLARTRRYFWSIKPNPILFGAVAITQTIATLLVVYGVFVAPIGWIYALLIWVYALASFLITDIIKVRFYTNLTTKTKSA